MLLYHLFASVSTRINAKLFSVFKANLRRFKRSTQPLLPTKFEHQVKTLWKAVEGVEHLKNTEAYVAPPPSAVDRAWILQSRDCSWPERSTHPCRSWPSPSDAGVRTRGRIPRMFSQSCCIREFLRRSLGLPVEDAKRNR